MRKLKLILSKIEKLILDWQYSPAVFIAAYGVGLILGFKLHITFYPAFIANSLMILAAFWYAKAKDWITV